MPPASLTFQELLRICLSEPVTWLAGEALSKRVVGWVVLASEVSQADDLVVVGSADFCRQLVDQARQRQAAGLLVLGAPLVRLELDEDLPIACAPTTPGEVQPVQRALLALLLNQRAALLERGVRIHSQLAELEAEGRGLEGLAHAMAEIAGRGVLVQDKRGRVLADAPSAVLQAIWRDVLNQLGSLESLPERLQDRRRAREQATAASQPVPGGLERLISPISVGEMARGYLSLVGLAGEFDMLDQLVLEQGTQVCALEMARLKAIREAEKRLKGDLLTALLQEDLSPRDARLWVQAMELDLEQAHVAVRFSWDGPEPPSRRRLETLVNGAVSLMNLKALVNPMGTEVVCFCQVPPQPVRPEAGLILGEAVLEQGGREYPHTPVRCGVGIPAVDMSDWRSSFRQAGQALEMARRLQAARPLFYTDLSVYRLLFQLEHNPELIAFQEEILGPLLAHEAAGEFIHTLEAFFEHNGNLSQTAEALFIHRNTLLYRMERLARITNLNLDKPDNRLAMQLALHIYKMRGKR
jgi:purine catabolism regulator